MKRLLFEILIILGISSAIALLYNAFTEDSLPLIPKPASENAVPDSLLSSKTYESTEKDLKKSVTFEQMQLIVKSDEFQIIDARRPDQYEKGFIGNAINLHPEYEDEGKYVESIFQLPMDKGLIIYCDGGTCDLSHKLAKELIHFGFKRLFIYHGGWEEWSVKTKS